MTTRKRGGQPGNTNALKHGFYSRRFTSLEHRDLESTQDDDLRSEAAMLRVVIRRVFEMSGDLETLSDACDFLRHISLAVGKLAAISRTQALYSLSAADEERQTITQALMDVMDELDLSV